MLTPRKREDIPTALVLEVAELTTALAGALDRAGIRLPQLQIRPEDDWAVRLGDCNVRVARALYNLIQDGLTLRKNHPEESVNA